MSEKPRILLVDDEPVLVKMVGKRLEAEGFELLVARDGQQGLDDVRAWNPDLIILDVALPKLTGYQVCVLLKQDPLYREIPIILFTVMASETDRKLGYQSGADVYVKKPFHAPELIGRIRALLQKASKNKGSTG